MGFVGLRGGLGLCDDGDVSDGMLLDASRIGKASGATLAISSEAVAPRAPENRLADALRWGDDYVLLATGPAGLDREFDVTCIGEVHPQTDHPVLLDGSVPEGDLGYTH